MEPSVTPTVPARLRCGNPRGAGGLSEGAVMWTAAPVNRGLPCLRWKQEVIRSWTVELCDAPDLCSSDFRAGRHPAGPERHHGVPSQSAIYHATGDTDVSSRVHELVCLWPLPVSCFAPSGVGAPRSPPCLDLTFWICVATSD